jgi:glycosyltransferase involved in cell wall biosynthesis
VFQNLDDKREFVAKGLVDEKKAVLIKGSGVDTTKFYAASAIEASAVKESLGIFADQVVVTMVARIIKDKGIFEYLDAATKLRAKYGEKTLFLLIGDSDLGNPTSVNIENMKHVGSKESGVWYLGARDDIVRVLHASDVYCLPSYREGLPMSVLEAMASGLPIVTTDAPGCRETVLEGINGYLVPVRDSNKIAEALDALISDSDMRQRFGAASRRRATQEFSKEKVVAEFVDLYMQLLQKK